MISGFVYCQFAGRELVTRPDDQRGGHGRPTPRGQSYDGPVQVRTSMAGMAIAAIVPAVITAALALILVSLTTMDVTATGSGFLSRPNALLTLGYPAQVLLATLIATAIPTAIFVAAVHGLARATRRSSGRAYAIIGALAGAAFGSIFLLLNAAFFIVPCVLLGAMTAGVYRRFAGVEPLSLPEPVLVRDTEMLVPDDHPARKTHTVVFNG